MPLSATSDIAQAPVLHADAAGFYALRVREVRKETRDAIVVAFEVPRELGDIFRFMQGQHLTLRAWIDREEVRRSYSICSAVQDGTLRIAIKKVADGFFSAWAIENLKPGCTMEVLPPTGHFYVPLSPENRNYYLAIAAGSGITPVISIVKTTLLAEPKSQFTLFYGNRASNTVIFREELADLKDLFPDRFNLVHVMTREHQDLDLLNGRITPEKCERLLKLYCPAEDVDTVFLCGPQEMSLGLAEELKSLGVPESKIKIELFSATPTPRKRAPQAIKAVTEQCEVTVISDGRERMFGMPKGDETILDAALHNGIELRYSCKSGVCATCRAKLITGQVDMDANYALEDYEVRGGFILTCQSYPLTDKVKVDFDQET